MRVVHGTSGGAKPSSTGQEDGVVVPIAEPTTTATPDSDPPPDSTPPSRPQVKAPAVDPCIETLRSEAGGPDPAKAKGLDVYRDALEAERAQKLDLARRNYLKLIQNYPDSTLIPAAYFAFGEMFRREAVGDPSKASLAEQSYAEVIKYPAGKGSLWTVTQYRMGQVFLASKPEKALSVFMKAAKSAQQNPDDGCVTEASAAALEGSAAAFAEAGQPDKCVTFYSSLTTDKGRMAVACVAVAEHLAAKKKGGDAQRVLAASLGPAAAAHMAQTDMDTYCKRAKAAADDAKASGGVDASLDKALAAACP
ncbi:MAG: hypothetical protein U0441_27840 [Polyangiaceae bacterium]